MNTYEYAYAIPAVVISAFLPIILDGVERKIKAALQSRIGPPITQTLYDLLKLTVKELKPVHTIPFISASLASSIVCAFASLYLAYIYSMNWDLVYLATSLSLLLISLTALTLTPLLIPNPFSYIGGMREVILALVNESSFAASATIYTITLNLARHQVTAFSLLALITSLVVMMVSGYALTGRLPFDIAEAEPELASGVYVEFSGKLLALYLYSNLVKRILVKTFISVLIVAIIGYSGILSLSISYSMSLALWVLFAVIAVTLGRSRVDLAPRTLAKAYITLLAVSITGLLVATYV